MDKDLSNIVSSPNPDAVAASLTGKGRLSFRRAGEVFIACAIDGVDGNPFLMNHQFLPDV